MLDSVGDSLALTSIFAALPLLTRFVLLGELRMRAWMAALISLAVSVVVAVVFYPMPVVQTLAAGTEGAAFGFFPILWIVINAIWVYNMTVVTGHFDVLRRSFSKISADQRIQGVIVAFSFGALLEALAGFGTPVAITSVMLARCRRDRLGHLVQLVVRCPAGHGREPGRSRPVADGGVELLRWRARQDDLATEPRDRLRRSGSERTRG